MSVCFAILALALWSQLPEAQASVVAVGKLQSCVNDGSSPTTTLSCSKQIVVTVALENNKLYETEQLNFTVSCVNSPTDECPCPCDYTKDPTCTCRDLQQSIVVSATKSAVTAIYPITYSRQFNGRPYEAIILGPSCTDGALDDKPTCGWATQYDDNGAAQRIVDSQGFCCKCTIREIVFGMDPTEYTRGGLNCADSRSRASASCLRYDDDWWWSGYIIGTYQLGFRVGLNVTTTQAANASTNSSATASSHSELLTVTPSQTFVINNERTVSAKLLGDLEAYAQIPDLAGKYLMIPTPPGQGPNDAPNTNYNEWMIIDSSMITTTGLDCNKIGISYTGFRNSQVNQCNVPQGSCLKNQIYDLYYQDLGRMTQGLDPQYFVGRYGGGSDNVNQMTSNNSGAGVQLSLNLPISNIKTSLLTLSVRADDVALITNRSPAKIMAAQVCTYASGSCGGFQSLTTRGYLLADVQNSGYVAADYTTSVLNCTAGVLPVLAQYASIAPQAIRRFTFQLQMETDQAIGNASCTVAVTDATGSLADTSAVTFYTNATNYEPTPNQSDLSGKITGPGQQSSGACAQACPALFNVKCSLQNGCYGRLASALGAVAGGLAALTLLILALQKGWITVMLKAVIGGLTSCCGSRASTAGAGSPPPPPASEPGASSSKPPKVPLAPAAGSGKPPKVPKLGKAGQPAEEDAAVTAEQGRVREKRGSSVLLQQAGQAARKSWNAAADKALEILQHLRLYQGNASWPLQHASVEGQRLRLPTESLPASPTAAGFHMQPSPFSPDPAQFYAASQAGPSSYPAAAAAGQGPYGGQSAQHGMGLHAHPPHLPPLQMNSSQPQLAWQQPQQQQQWQVFAGLPPTPVAGQINDAFSIPAWRQPMPGQAWSSGSPTAMSSQAQQQYMLTQGTGGLALPPLHGGTAQPGLAVPHLQQATPGQVEMSALGPGALGPAPQLQQLQNPFAQPGSPGSQQLQNPFTQPGSPGSQQLQNPFAQPGSPGPAPLWGTSCS